MAEVPKKKRLVVLQDRPAGDDQEPPPEERPAGHWVIASAVITVIAWVLLAGTSNAILQRAHVESLLVLVISNVAALLAASGLAGAATGRYGAKASRKHATYGTLSAAAFGWTLWMTSGGAEAAVQFLVITLALLLGIAWAGGAAGYRLGARRSKRA